MNDTQNFTGTRPVAAQHAVDATALQTWLERHVEGFAGPLSIEMFKGGQSNPTYKLLTPARRGQTAQAWRLSKLDELNSLIGQASRFVALTFGMAILL